VSWAWLPDQLTGDALPSGGQRWLKLWPGKRGGNGRRIHRLLKRNGRTAVSVEIEYGANGHELTRRGKRVVLSKAKKRIRHARLAAQRGRWLREVRCEAGAVPPL
jgi:hypothetical protein